MFDRLFPLIQTCSIPHCKKIPFPDKAIFFFTSQPINTSHDHPMKQSPINSLKILRISYFFIKVETFFQKAIFFCSSHFRFLFGIFSESSIRNKYFSRLMQLTFSHFNSRPSCLSPSYWEWPSQRTKSPLPPPATPRRLTQNPNVV